MLKPRRQPPLAPSLAPSLAPCPPLHHPPLTRHNGRDAAQRLHHTLHHPKVAARPFQLPGDGACRARPACTQAGGRRTGSQAAARLRTQPGQRRLHTRRGMEPPTTTNNGHSKQASPGLASTAASGCCARLTGGGGGCLLASLPTCCRPVHIFESHIGVAQVMVHLRWGSGQVAGRQEGRWAGNTQRRPAVGDQPIGRWHGCSGGCQRLVGPPLPQPPWPPTSRQKTLPSAKQAPKPRTGRPYREATAAHHSSSAATCGLPAATSSCGANGAAAAAAEPAPPAAAALPATGAACAALARTSSTSARTADRLMSCTKGRWAGRWRQDGVGEGMRVVAGFGRIPQRMHEPSTCMHATTAARHRAPPEAAGSAG